MFIDNGIVLLVREKNYVFDGEFMFMVVCFVNVWIDRLRNDRSQ